MWIVLYLGEGADNKGLSPWDNIMEYYLVLNGSQSGPHTEQKVRSLLASGEVTGESLAWREGLADWQPLSTLLPAQTPATKTGMAVPMAAPATITDRERDRGSWVPASRGIRLVASLIDMAPVLVAMVVVGGVMVATGAKDFDKLPESTQIGVAAGLGLLLLAVAVVQLYLLAKHSQTIGKRMCKIRIYDIHSGRPADWIHTILLRIFVNGAIGSVPCVGGFYGLVDILFIFREDRRCLHDLIASTVVGTAE